MRAKLINEIQRGSDSGLGSISIGKSAILKSYYLLNKKWPIWFNENAKTLKDVFDDFEKITKSQEIKKYLNYYKDVLKEAFGESIENYMAVYDSVYDSKIFNPVIEYENDIIEIYERFNIDDHPAVINLFDDELDNGNRLTFSSACNYNSLIKMGQLYLNNIETPSNKNMHCIFVKYK